MNNKTKWEIYHLPLHEERIAHGVYWGEIFEPRKMKDEKVIIMIGATGSGKSNLINRIINYIFGISYTDPFRFRLIRETGKSETKTQTTDIHIYNIDHEKLPYKLTIIDSPGINPATGHDEDKRTIEKFKYLFETNRVEAVNAVCLVEKYNTIHLTEIQIKIFQTIATMFGNNVRENTFIMATFCDDVYDDTTESEPPQLLEFFKEQKFDFTDHYLFNNKDIYKNPDINKNRIRKQVKKAFWDRSTTSFKDFFERLDITPPVGLKLTKEILQKKHNITNAQLPYLVRALSKNIHDIETLEQDRRIIEKMINNAEKTYFTAEVVVTKVILEDITEPNCYSTWCNTCEIVCHHPCNIHEDHPLGKGLWRCSAMSWFFNWRLDVKCTACPGKCSWKDHKQINQKPVFKKEKVTRNDESLKQIYLEDKAGELETVNKRCEEKMVLACKKLLEDFREIRECIDYINQHILSSKPTTMQEYVDDVISTQLKYKIDGYEQRIHCLKKLVEMKDQDVPTNVLEVKSFIQGMLKKEA